MSTIPGLWHTQRAVKALGTVVRRRSRRGLVLLYHRVAGPRFDPQLLDVTPQNFDAQMRVLSERMEPLALSEFEKLRRAGKLPARAVAVTFDDGYADNLYAAAPRLNANGIPATVFVTAGMIGSGREFWWDEVERIAFMPRVLNGMPPALSIPWRIEDGAAIAAEDGGMEWNVAARVDPSSRHRLYRGMVAALRRMPTTERDVLVSRWRDWSGVTEGARESHRTVSTKEVIALAEARGVSIGAHTMTHPSLAQLSATEQAHELRDSRRWLETTIAKPVTAVAYPYGESADVSAITVAAARTAGFDTGYSNIGGTAWRWSSRWRVPRILVRDWDAVTFLAQLDRWFVE